MHRQMFRSLSLTKPYTTARRRRCTKRGFTLIEMLVSIGIIAILVSITIPAIQQARMAAIRTQSENNLRNLVLAANNFQTQFGYFPPGAISKSFPGSPVSDLPADESVQHAWGVFLLPFLEQSALYQQYSMKHCYMEPENQRVVSTALPIFLSPAVPVSERVGTLPDGERLAASDFHPPRGVSMLLTEPHADWGDMSIVPHANYDGIMGYNIVTRPSAITDGLTNTILLIEVAGGPAIFRNGRELVGAQAVGYSPYDPQSPFLVDGSCEYGSRYPGPYWNLTNLSGLDGEPYGFHTNVILTGFADGSVRRLAKELDIRVFVKLVGKADGMVIEDY